MKKNKWISIIPLFLFCICLLSGCKEKTLISLEDFQTILENHGCTIEGDIIIVDEEEGRAVYTNGTKFSFYDITYCEFEKEQSCQEFYAQCVEDMKETCNSFTENSKDQCYGSDDTQYHFISKAGNTCICADTDLDFQEEVIEILEELQVADPNDAPAEEESAEDAATTNWVTATQTEYDNSDVTSYKEFSYDDEHRLVSTIQYDVPGGTVTKTWLYTYDENDNITLEVVMDSNGSEERTEYTYDENGNIISEANKNSDEDSFTQYNYDENNNMTEEVHSSSGEFSYLIEYTYDDNNNLILAKHPSSDEFFDYYSEYTYDENGNLTLEVDTYSDDREGYSEYTYDKNGNMTSEVHVDWDGAAIKSEYTYDENGNKTMTVCWNPIGESYTEYYFYDKNGNKIADAKAFDVSIKLLRNKYTYESYEAPAAVEETATNIESLEPEGIEAHKEEVYQDGSDFSQTKVSETESETKGEFFVQKFLTGIVTNLLKHAK